MENKFLLNNQEKKKKEFSFTLKQLQDRTQSFHLDCSLAVR